MPAGDEAVRRETLKFDAEMYCPDCGGPATLFAGRKSSTARIECDHCGIVEQGVIPYGAGLVVGE